MSIISYSQHIKSFFYLTHVFSYSGTVIHILVHLFWACWRSLKEKKEENYRNCVLVSVIPLWLMCVCVLLSSVCFPQVPPQRPPLPLKAHFYLSTNLPVGLYRLEIDQTKKARLPAVIFFPLPHPGGRLLAGFGALPQRVNKCISADDCEARKDWILTPFHLCVWWRKRVSLLEIGSDRWGTWKKTATPALQPGWIRKLSAN